MASAIGSTEPEGLAREVAVPEERLAQANEQLITLHEKLRQFDEGRANLVAALGRLLQKPAERYARLESAFRSELEHRSERLAEAEMHAAEAGALRVKLMASEVQLRAVKTEWQAEEVRLQAVETQLQDVCASSSWCLTTPLRRFLAHQPRLRRLAGASVRGAWRAPKSRPERGEPPEVTSPVLEVPPALPVQAEERLVFRRQAIWPVTNGLLPSLPRGTGRRALCVGHALSFLEVVLDKHLHSQGTSRI